MGIYHNLPHWNYYRLLEQDLESCFRFVNPSQEHWNVYSDEFSRIILVAASEIENALRTFALWSQTNPIPSSILKYFECITTIYPHFYEMELVMPRYSVAIKPWEDWSESAAPDWWTYGYNKIKHDRLNYPNAPTLIRAIKSVGALQVLLLHFYRYRYKDCELAYDIQPSLFIPWEKEKSWLGATISWGWDLPDDSIE
jgi:hypothetical protein